MVSLEMNLYDSGTLAVFQCRQNGTQNGFLRAAMVRKGVKGIREKTPCQRLKGKV